MMGTVHPSIVAGRELMLELHGKVQAAAESADEPLLFYASFFAGLAGQMSAVIGHGPAMAVFDCIRPAIDAISATAEGPAQ